jgi:3-oxoacyl-[acyl-carrier-protein] synthase-3
MNMKNKPSSPIIPVGIRGLGYYLPKSCLDNQKLIKLGSPVSIDWILEKTGIQSRYIADDSEAMSDLVIHAAKMALSSAYLTANHIEALIVSGDLHDSGGVQLTSTAVALGLGISDISCFDLRAGCPSSVMVLHLGTAFVASKMARRILVTAAEINTRGIDYTDRTSVWFGDGAGAAILEPCIHGTGILATYVSGTGEGSGILTVPAGGSREPLTSESLNLKRHHLQMDGKAVFPFAVKKMVESLERITNYLGLTPHNLDRIIPHQANLRIIEAAMKVLNLPIEKAYVNLERVGNTAGASVLLALAEAYSNRFIRPGDIIATVGFGGGLAWGAQLIRVNHPEDFKN